MAFRYYAVRVGRKTGIYTNVKSAESNIKGVTGSQMKGFNDKDQANNWINHLTQKPKHRDLNNRNIVVYTDGSHNKKADQYGSGVVITRHSKIIAELSIMGSEEEYTVSNQAPGELFAVIYALQWAVEHGCNHVEINYDFSTAKHLALGQCIARTPVSKEYYRRFHELAHVIGTQNITFTKIKAHSGDPGNARADQLARSACGN